MNTSFIIRWRLRTGSAWLFCVLLGLASLSPGREVRFLAWDDAMAERPIALISGGRHQPIEGFHPLQRSSALTVHPAGEEGVPPYLVEGGEARWMAEREGPGYSGLPLVIPPAVRNPLVILIPAREGGLGLRTLVLEDDVRNFSWGSFRILNTTASPLVLLTRGHRRELPSDWTPVDLSLNGDNNEPVVIGIEDPQQGLTLVYSSIWMPDSESRRLVLILPSEDARLGYLHLKIIPEFKLPPPPADGTEP